MRKKCLKKIGPIPAPFCLFSLFWIIQIEKSIDGVLGIWTRGRRMVGADETTELWRKFLADRYKGQSFRYSTIVIYYASFEPTIFMQLSIQYDTGIVIYRTWSFYKIGHRRFPIVFEQRWPNIYLGLFSLRVNWHRCYFGRIHNRNLPNGSVQHAVWPDWAKLCRSVNFLKIFCNFL